MLLQKCSHCGHDAPMRCPQCRTVWYCGREHQKADWRRHKLVCAPPDLPDAPVARLPTPPPTASQAGALEALTVEELKTRFRQLREPERLLEFAAVRRAPFCGHRPEFPSFGLDARTDAFEGELLVSTASSVFLIGALGQKAAAIDREGWREADLARACAHLVAAASGVLITSKEYIETRVAFTALLDGRTLYIGLTARRPKRGAHAGRELGMSVSEETRVCVADLRLRTLRYAFRCKADVQVHPLDGGHDSRLLLAGPGDAQLWDPVLQTVAPAPFVDLLRAIRSSQAGWAFLFFADRTTYCSLVSLAGRCLSSADTGCRDAQTLNTCVAVSLNKKSADHVVFRDEPAPAGDYGEERHDLAARVRIPLTGEAVDLPLVVRFDDADRCASGATAGQFLVRLNRGAMKRVRVLGDAIVVEDTGLFGRGLLDGALAYSHTEADNSLVTTETSVYDGTRTWTKPGTAQMCAFDRGVLFCPGGAGLFRVRTSPFRALVVTRYRDAEGRLRSATYEDMVGIEILGDRKGCTACNSIDQKWSVPVKAWGGSWAMTSLHAPASAAKHTVLHLFATSGRYSPLERHVWSIALDEAHATDGTAMSFCAPDRRVLDALLPWCPAPLVELIVAFVVVE